MPKFKIGDKVKIVNFGHWIVDHKDGLWSSRDIEPQLVGKTGIIREVSDKGDNGVSYALKPIDFKGKEAWYNERQLELMTECKYESTPAGAFEQRYNILREDVIRYIEDKLEEGQFHFPNGIVLWPEDNDLRTDVQSLYRSGNEYFITIDDDTDQIKDLFIDYLLEIAKQISK